MDGRDANGRLSVGGRDARIHVNRASPRLVSLPHHIDRPINASPPSPSSSSSVPTSLGSLFLTGSSRGMSTRDKLFAFLVLGVMSAAAVGLVIAVTCAARSGAVSLTVEVCSHRWVIIDATVAEAVNG